MWRPEAGGHVKSWERFVQAATGLEGELDLTVHLLGQRQERVALSPNVRYVTPSADLQHGGGPSWQEVLVQDLLPVWRPVAASRSPYASTPRAP